MKHVYLAVILCVVALTIGCEDGSSNHGEPEPTLEERVMAALRQVVWVGTAQREDFAAAVPLSLTFADCDGGDCVSVNMNGEPPESIPVSIVGNRVSFTYAYDDRILRVDTDPPPDLVFSGILNEAGTELGGAFNVDAPISLTPRGMWSVTPAP